MPVSPIIKSASWGKIVVGDKVYKDAKLFPGGSREWDWNETGTNHQEGIQVQDLEEIIRNGAEILVLSKGYLNQLNVGDAVRKFLKDQHIEYHICNTSLAVKKYNKLAQTHHAGALIHSTC